MKHSIYYAVAIMTAGLILFQAFPEPLLRMFNASDTMLSIGIPALRIISTCFVFAGVGIASSGAFQALGKATYSMMTSLARQLVVLLPVAFGLAQLGNVNLVWWALPVAELVSLAMTVFFLFRLNRSVISGIGE